MHDATPELVIRSEDDAWAALEKAVDGKGFPANLNIRFDGCPCRPGHRVRVRCRAGSSTRARFAASKCRRHGPHHPLPTDQGDHMERTCLKCGHIDPAAAGGEMDACPCCGAIYAKVAASLNAEPNQASGNRRVIHAKQAKMPHNQMTWKQVGDSLMGLVFLAIPLLLIVRCSLEPSTTSQAPAYTATQSAPMRVTYEVDGTAHEASLTYHTETGGTEQRDVSLPWQTTFTADEGTFLYLSAQNRGEFGTVIAKIRVNAITVKESRSEGAYKIASVNTRL